MMMMMMMMIMKKKKTRPPSPWALSEVQSSQGKIFLHPLLSWFSQSPPDIFVLFFWVFPSCYFGISSICILYFIWYLRYLHLVFENLGSVFVFRCEDNHCLPHLKTIHNGDGDGGGDGDGDGDGDDLVTFRYVSLTKSLVAIDWSCDNLRNTRTSCFSTINILLTYIVWGPSIS